MYLYVPFLLYLGYSIHKYTKNKSKTDLITNIGVAFIIQGVILCVHENHINKLKTNGYLNKKSCILDKSKPREKKKVRFDPEVSIRLIKNRYEM